MDSLDCLKTRRSVRRFTEEPVAPEALDEILQAAMLAPSAKNQQPWHFVVVKDAETRAKMAEVHPYMSFARFAPVVILVCVEEAITPLPLAACDASAATMNILLAAHSLGLGATWCACWPYEERQKPLEELLGIPEGVRVISAIPLGHPAKELPEVPDRYQAGRVHPEKW